MAPSQGVLGVHALRVQFSLLFFPEHRPSHAGQCCQKRRNPHNRPRPLPLATEPWRGLGRDGGMEGISSQPAPIAFSQASGYAMEGHGTFWPALDTATRYALVGTMMARVRAAALGLGRLASAAEELGLEGVEQGEAIRVLAGYGAFAQVSIDWASMMWVHSDTAALPKVKRARRLMEQSERAGYIRRRGDEEEAVEGPVQV